MTITFYNNKSDKNVLFKSLDTEREFTDCVLKDETDLLNPVIRIKSSYDFSLINYCYIPMFHRFYFINDVKYTVNGIYELSCSVDVLMSWKDKIRAHSAIIRRQEKVNNYYLADSEYKKVEYENVQTLKFAPSHVFNPEGPNFVLICLGGDRDWEPSNDGGNS